MGSVKTQVLIVFIIGLFIGSSFSTVISSSNQQSREPISSEEIDWWPCFHHDVQNSGYST